MSSASDALQRLAVAHAMAAWAKGLEAQARSEADAALREAHEATGACNARVLVGGTKVGTLSVAVSNAAVRVFDQSAYEAWLEGLYRAGDQRVVRRVSYELPGLPKEASVIAGQACDPATGEVIPGVEWVAGGDVCSTRLSGCKVDDVRCAMLAAGIPFGWLDGQAALPGGEA